MAYGQCVRITTQSPWAVIGSDQDGVTLVSYRGSVGRPGSFYVPTSALDFSAPVTPPQDATPGTPQADPNAGIVSPAFDGSIPRRQAQPARREHRRPRRRTPPARTRRCLQRRRSPRSRRGVANQPPGVAASGPAATQPAPVPPATNDQDLAQLKADIAKDNPAGGFDPGAVVRLLCPGWHGRRRLVFHDTQARRTTRRLLDAIRAESPSTPRLCASNASTPCSATDFGSVNWTSGSMQNRILRTRVQPIVTTQDLPHCRQASRTRSTPWSKAAATSAPAMGSTGRG